MIVQELLRTALRKLGNVSPTPDQYSDALLALNFSLNNFTYWDETINPVLEYDSVNDLVSLPYMYIEALVWSVAAQEAKTYGQDPTYFELKAKEISNKVDFPNAQSLSQAPITEVI